MSDELERAGRLNGTLGVLLLDLDHFKRVNDEYGHLVGRYGGEEFAVVLPGLDADGTDAAAGRIRTNITALEVTVPDLHGNERVVGGMTASAGAAVYPAHGHDCTSLLLAADAALYLAKAAGRDRTRLSKH